MNKCKRCIKNMIYLKYKNKYIQKYIQNVYYHKSGLCSGLTLIETSVTLGLLGVIVPVVFILSGSVSSQYAHDVLATETFLESQIVISRLKVAFEKNQPVFFHDDALFVKQGGQELLISNPSLKIRNYATSSLSSTVQERLRSYFSIGSTTYESFFEKPY